VQDRTHTFDLIVSTVVRDGRAAVGTVLRGDTGTTLRVAGRTFGPIPRVQASYRALLRALWNARTLGARRLRVSHQSFFQVNRHLTALLIARVTDGLEGRVALDLYAGVGLFAQALAERFARVLAVESDPSAAADLTANLSEIEGAEARAATVADFLAEQPEKCDAVVLDPPRAGLDRGVAEALVELAPPRLVYLSCDPATLARDLARLLPAYRLAALELIDLFPQTFHLETLARLERA